MKLATLNDGSRDGQLVVVSRDLATAHYATNIANRLQQALDDWGFFAPQLQDLFDALNAGRARHAFPFDSAQCMAPLPRAYQCLQRAESTSAADRRPGLHQLSGDALLGPQDNISAARTALGVDFGAGLAVITGDIPLAASSEQALDGVRLLLLANTITLRALEEQERSAGHSPLVSRPATAFGPVAVTPDELGSAWHQGRVQLTLAIGLNGRKFGLCDAAAGMPASFGEILAEACATRPLRTGSIVCSGPLRASHGADGAAEGARSYATLAARRQAEAHKEKDNKTGYLQAGDALRMDMKNLAGASLFGAIEQGVVI